jgi:hypothetical protein
MDHVPSKAAADTISPIKRFAAVVFGSSGSFEVICEKSLKQNAPVTTVRAVIGDFASCLRGIIAMAALLLLFI